MKKMVNILIVDDKIENIIALEALIQRDDIKIITTTSANEALKLCWQNKISIALIDVQMPEMDGFELVDILKSNPKTRDIVVVFVTAISTEIKYAVKGLSAGAVDYLYKPLDPNLTIAKVDSLITLVRTQLEIKHKNIELERYQEELIIARDQAEKGKKIKERFLANMSHEIRTPLNGILGLAHLLKNTELDEDQSRMLDLLKLSSEALLGVINDILDISKIDAGKFKIIRNETNILNLSKSVIDLLKYKAEEKGINISVDIDYQIPHLIMADSMRLNQILLNLLSNAIKFTDTGSIILRVALLEAEENKIKLRFSVIDSGIGIQENKLDKIFDSFEQADEDTDHKYGGTGLGLSIVKKLVQLKGGQLDVSSEFGKGSTFSFTNWYEVASDQKQENRVNPADLAKFDNVSVLVAEDNAINQFMICKILNSWNLKVTIVENGQLALESLKYNSFDIVLMDTHMPVLGGFEATRRIRSEMPEGINNIPIISLSAAVLEEEMQQAYDAGVNDIVSKPFDLTILHHKIEKLIKQYKEEFRVL
ncbi:response regulator [Pedobacter sp. P351]|uniref:response regulator n=1 Tax=Pedobacter superstes TaxID=3133441 RepID=UPI0030B1C5AD